MDRKTDIDAILDCIHKGADEKSGDRSGGGGSHRLYCNVAVEAVSL